jgi:hypothetical protein
MQLTNSCTSCHSGLFSLQLIENLSYFIDASFRAEEGFLMRVSESSRTDFAESSYDPTRHNVLTYLTLKDVG